MKFTARSRLETYASISRVQSDEETYDLEHSTVGSALAGVTDDRCGQCCACDRTVVPVAVGDREVGDMEMTERNQEAPTQEVVGPFAWLVQSTTERNPPHGWAVHMFNGQQVRDSVPVYLKQEVDRLRNTIETLQASLFQTQKAAERLLAKGKMLAAVVQGAKEEFVRVPYGASHEDVAAINDWHRMADEALKEWK